MSSLRKMVAMAIDATGDESIFVAGDFQPKGMVWKQVAGGMAGSAIGDAVGAGAAVAETAGAAVGFAAGTLATTGTNSELPMFVVLAASPTKLYVLSRQRHKGELLAHHLGLLHVMDRSGLVVTIGGAVTVRTAIIEDHASNCRLELEGVKYGAHANAELLAELGGPELTPA